MIALLILACLGTSSCDMPDRVDIYMEFFSSPMGCMVAGNLVLSEWHEQNPGWRAERYMCVPVDRIDSVLARLLGEEV